ncbi:MAG: DUF1559 domain-containing protein, partial [Bacteroidales bacterium]|nr:DUF1559 domain-containing protein [Bacteroidales bacterium]
QRKLKIYRLTLIEVVVMVSITIILALLFSVFVLGKARESRRRISCTSNLKNIGLSLRMYSNVYSEVFPDKKGRAGLQMLAENGFLENTQVYICPSSQDHIADTTGIATGSSYCYANGLTEADSVDSALVADRANNHSRFGNILFIDGHVKGYIGASWSSNRGDSILTDF